MASFTDVDHATFITACKYSLAGDFIALMLPSRLNYKQFTALYDTV